MFMGYWINSYGYFQANNIIPPPYSHMGSLEEITTDSQLPATQQTVAVAEHRHLPRSASNNSNTEYHQVEIKLIDDHAVVNIIQ